MTDRRERYPNSTAPRGPPASRSIMHKPRLISLPVATALSAAAFAGPAAASHSHLPGPPMWPTKPQPITSYAYQLPGPPTWPTNPQPIAAYHSTVQAAGGGLDWDSAGIGAAA